MDELRKLQRNLEADQRAWATKKLELEQEVTRLNTTLDVLVPKTEAARVELTRLRTELTKVNDRKTAAEQEAQSTLADIARLDQNVQRREMQLADLDALIATKQTRIDDGLADYTRQRRAELDTELAGLMVEVQTKTGELGKIQRQVDEKRQELAAVLAELTVQRATTLQEASDASEKLRGLRMHIPPLEAKLSLIERQFKQASLQRDQILADTEKARVEHKNFLDYEAKARKLLATKDRELQDKRDELEVTGRHLTARKSFLSEL